MPYVVALIDLAEGVRMMSNVVDCPPESVTVGMDVAITWKPLSDGRHLPQFAPRLISNPGESVHEHDHRSRARRPRSSATSCASGSPATGPTTSTTASIRGG